MRVGREQITTVAAVRNGEDWGIVVLRCGQANKGTFRDVEESLDQLGAGL